MGAGCKPRPKLMPRKTEAYKNWIVTEAGFLEAQRRYVMIDEMEPAITANPEMESAELTARRIYPLFACVIPAPKSFDEFCDIPDDDSLELFGLVDKLNPHWLGRERMSEKKSES